MKVTKSQLRRIIKEEKAKLMEQPQDATLARTESQYGASQSGDPQSYADFAKRLDQVTLMLEDLTMDYVDSGWLIHGDHATLAGDTEDAFTKVDSLAMAAMGLAQSMGEV